MSEAPEDEIRQGLPVMTDDELERLQLRDQETQPLSARDWVRLQARARLAKADTLT